MRAQRAHLGAARRIPEFDRVIVAARGDSASVRGKRHGIDLACVSLECPLLAASTQLPKHYHAVSASCSECPVIGREGDGVKLVTAPEGSQLALRADIPELCSSVLADRCEHPAVGGKCDRSDGIGMPELRKYLGRGTRGNASRPRTARQAPGKHDQAAAPKDAAVALDVILSVVQVAETLILWPDYSRPISALCRRKRRWL